MSPHALLKLQEGLQNSMGLGEIKFHYPPASGRENELCNKAKRIIKAGRFFKGFHWSLINEPNLTQFQEYIQAALPDSEIITVPLRIMHGNIRFKTCFRINNTTAEDKDRIVSLLMESDIPVHINAMSLEISGWRKEREHDGFGPIPPEEIDAETRATFARNLTFHKE